MGPIAFYETAQRSAFNPEDIESVGLVDRGSRLIVVVPGCALVALLCWLQVVAWQWWPVNAEAIGYGCFGLSLWACAAAFAPFVRAARGYLRVRVSLFVAGLATAACCYSMVFVQHMGWMPEWVGLPNSVALTCVSEGLYLLAATMLFSGASKTIASVDAAQAILFAVLRFSLTYATHERTHLAPNHIQVMQSVAVFLFVTAAVASLSAATREESRLLRMLSIFLGLRVVGVLCADQVSYVWLHHAQGSMWDIPHTLLMGGFAVFVAAEFRRPMEVLNAARPARNPSMALRNLMPSLLAVGNVALGLCVLGQSAVLAGLAVAAALTLYVLRTVMLQSQMEKERVRLQSRNRQLETLATKDAVTGAGNRHSMGAVYRRLRRSKDARACTLLLVDIDKFKQTNDQFGHVHGDKVLTAVASVLRGLEASVTDAHCARFGGDEFALLLPNVGTVEGLRVAEEIRSKVAALRVDGAGTSKGGVSVSVGGAAASDVAEVELEELMEVADKALYRAKVFGRNRAVMAGESGVRCLELQEAG